MKHLVEDAAHFQHFAKQVEVAVEQYGEFTDENLLVQQGTRVNKLSSLEVEFKEILVNHPKCKEAFDAFFDFIVNEKGNLLSARPYFRERSTAFCNGLMAAIRNRDYLTVCKFQFNYLMIQLMTSRIDFENGRLTEISDEIIGIRHELVLMNLPLVISRARIFYGKTSKAHLSFMDLVQIGVGGLLSAIDKYCGAYERVWRGVAIGRLTGDCIKFFSETTLHFYPDDRTYLYRANKFLSRHADGDYDEKDLLAAVNQQVGKSDAKRPKICMERLRQLLEAARTVSCDTRPPLDDENVGEENINRMAAPSSTRPDVRYEKMQALHAMSVQIQTLSILDRKILKLKGIQVDD